MKSLAQKTKIWHNNVISRRFGKYSFFFDQFRLKLLDPQSFHFFSLEKSNLRAQLLSKTFFDIFIFKNNLFLKWCCQILIFAGLITLAKNVQKSFQCDFCNQWNISFILKSFYQIPLTWSKTYVCIVLLTYKDISAEVVRGRP